MLSKMAEITANKPLMDSIGGRREVQYHYNDDFVKLDTFSYWIKIRGYTGELFYRSFEGRLKGAEWSQLSDPLIIRKF